jgi:hypothetical protein
VKKMQRNFAVTDEEAARLDAVSAALGLDWASAVRLLVKREHDRLSLQTSSTTTGHRPTKEEHPWQQRKQQRKQKRLDRS